MRTIDIREAKARLSRLVREAAEGEPFIIARGGKPLVKVVPLQPPKPVGPRIGFMRGRLRVPDDFDDLGRGEIERLFRG